jgi:hypothetical protein
VAEADAIRRRRSDFSAEGQQRLERAASAACGVRRRSDPTRTPQRPYAKARHALDGLMVLPAITRAGIERRIAGEIEA